MNIISIFLLWLAAFTGGQDGIINQQVPDSKITVQDHESQSSSLAGPTTVIALEDTHFRPAK